LTVSPIELLKKIGSALFGPAHPETPEEVLPEEELEEAVSETAPEIPSEPLFETAFESEEPEELEEPEEPVSGENESSIPAESMADIPPRGESIVPPIREGTKMRVISVMNYKGGVGKTTITANLAASLAKRGKRVLLIDLDPQCSLSFSFFHRKDWKQKFSETKTVKNWYDAFIDKDFNCSLENLVVDPEVPIKGDGRLHMICSHLALINIEIELSSKLSGSSERELRNNYLRVHSRLSQGVKSLKGRYDVVLIDCPPSFNIVTTTAVTASDYLIVPTIPDYLSTLGIDYLNNKVEDLVETYNRYVDICDDPDFTHINPLMMGVLFNLVQFSSGNPIRAQEKYIDEVRKKKYPVFEIMLRENRTFYSSSSSNPLPAVLRRSVGPAQQKVVNELEDLASEVLGRME